MYVKEAPIDNRQEHLDLGNVGQTVAEILEKINVLDEEFEGNLSTILAPIRGTNEYWFHVKGEVKAMIADYGSPTLFRTLSCAEYDSTDIAQYLRKVNNAQQSYSISRLCTEDPVSVSCSRQIREIL
uniref:Helitron helicase-like domain-containing protein n=1 Tax=Amphimedon queenslandica TaxID=400682 RepID=A0A1X7V5P0_AMPQE